MPGVEGDKYPKFATLARHEHFGIAYRVLVRHTRPSFAIVAPHGGGSNWHIGKAREPAIRINNVDKVFARGQELSRLQERSSPPALLLLVVPTPELPRRCERIWAAAPAGPSSPPPGLGVRSRPARIMLGVRADFGCRAIHG
jgi:hypothetical protein